MKNPISITSNTTRISVTFRWEPGTGPHFARPGYEAPEVSFHEITAVSNCPVRHQEITIDGRGHYIDSDGNLQADLGPRSMGTTGIEHPNIPEVLRHMLFEALLEEAGKVLEGSRANHGDCPGGLGCICNQPDEPVAPDDLEQVVDEAIRTRKPAIPVHDCDDWHDGECSRCGPTGRWSR